jgi:4-carboxymuconolactone decarboxylase
MTTQRYQDALDAYRAHTGKDFTWAPAPGEPPAMQDMFVAMMESSYGASWSRPGLDTRTKCFISLTVTASLGTGELYKTHLRHAHHSGITKDEIAEFLIHINAYAGAPRAASAFFWTREVWQEG